MYSLKHYQLTAAPNMPLPFCPSPCAQLSKRSKLGESATCVICTGRASLRTPQNSLAFFASHSRSEWDLAGFKVLDMNETLQTRIPVALQAYLSGQGQFGAVPFNDPPKLQQHLLPEPPEVPGCGCSRVHLHMKIRFDWGL
jgi:hypothetical protein